MTRVAICFVCLGNICRSPTAEGVMRHQVDAAGLADRIAIDSAGTGDWHVGEPPDTRAQAAARIRGYDLSALRARQVSAADFERFDLLLAMDEANLAELRRRCPPEHRGKVFSVLRIPCRRHGYLTKIVKYLYLTKIVKIAVP